MISASMKVVLTCLLLVYTCYRYTALIITLSVKLTVVLMNILWVIFMSLSFVQRHCPEETFNNFCSFHEHDLNII